MAEFAISKFDPESHIKDMVLHSRPALVFLGDLFEFDAGYIRIKNLLNGNVLK